MVGFRIYKCTNDLTLFAGTIDNYYLGYVSSGSALTYTDSNADPSQANYYVIRTVDQQSVESNNSNILDSTNLDYVIIMSNDGGSYAIMPILIVKDIEVSLPDKNTEIGGKILASYQLKGLSNESKELVDIGKQVTIKFVIGSAAPSPALRALSAQKTTSTNSKQMSIYYYNGVEYLKMGGVVSSDNRTISSSINRYGTYQIREAFRASDFNVLSVEPKKIITPNGDCINDFFTVRFDNPLDSSVTARIYDINGRNIGSMKTIDANSQSCLTASSDSSLTWDGRDERGELMDAGVYVYQITTTEGKRFTGTIVIAK